MQELEIRYEIARLIAGKLTETLSEAEIQRLEEWKNSSDRNNFEYREIRRRLAKDMEHAEYLELSREWKEFEKRLPQKKQAFKFWFAVAAACVVVCLAVTFLWMQSLSHEPVIAEVSHGAKGFKATLILGNGEQVVIRDSLNKVLAISKGTKIMTTGNRVKYEAQEVAGKEDVEWNTIVIPRGGEYELELADGSRVWLNSESRLTYPVCFTGDTREVKMEGEVCFDIVKNDQQPFIVKTAALEVRVLGTLFNIEAYPEDQRVTTTLVRGKVEVTADQRSQILQPDQQLTVGADEFDLKQVEADDYISWTNGLFHFTEASLEEIMTKLARWYDVEFFFANPALKEVHFSLDIQRYEHIAAILSKLEKTGRAQFRISGKTVVIEE